MEDLGLAKKNGFFFWSFMGKFRRAFFGLNLRELFYGL
jgi:hypothetical protein